MNRVTLRIPVPLQEFTGGRETLTVGGNSVREVLAAAGEANPGLLARILTPEGERRPFVNVFVGETNVRQMQDLDTPVSDGDEVHVIAAVAGG
ncbi:MAG: MoaD/ThiS family protein [Gammaproteobacteria bacterium]